VECSQDRASGFSNHHQGIRKARAAASRALLVCMVKEWSHCTACGRVSLYYVSTEHSDCTDTDCHSETRSWDVRTKKVTYDVIPTIEGIIGIANYGTTATLFTLGHNYTAQQYDITPNQMPIQVQNVQHVPANTPPTPPTTLEEQKNSRNVSWC
jgi:hypothetical protein